MSQANYRRGVKWLDENHPFFTSFVIALGVPAITSTAKTAEVRLNRTTDEIELALNPTLFDPMTDAEIGGVLAHEAYHVLLNHLHETTETETYPDAHALTCAHECIINDGLANELFPLPELGLLYGPDLIGEDCSGMSTKQAYDLFAARNQEQDKDDSDEDSQDGGAGEGQGGTSGGAGEVGEASGGAGGTGEECPFAIVIQGDALDELADRLDEAMMDAAHAANIKAEDIPDALGDKMADMGVDTGMTDTSNMKGLGAGTQASAADVMMDQNANLNMNWVEILSIINPKMMHKEGENRHRTKANWAQPRRKTAYAYPNIILPTIKPVDNKDGNTPDKKPTVLLALDFSGSIPASMLPRLAYLANSIPDKLMDLHVFTFSTWTCRFDPKITGHQKTASGGTDFSAIEREALTLQKQNPNHDYPYVICITDGDARFNTQKPTSTQLAEQWFWIGVDSYDTRTMKNGGGYYSDRDIFKRVYDMPVA